MLRYFKNILIGIDQLINTLFLGDPGETISSRTGKYIRANSGSWFAARLNAFLNFFQDDHSLKSIEDDEGRNAIIRNLNK